MWDGCESREHLGRDPLEARSECGGGIRGAWTGVQHVDGVRRPMAVRLPRLREGIVRQFLEAELCVGERILIHAVEARRPGWWRRK